MAKPNESDWLLYGATGYAGQLIIEEALANGLNPTIAGPSPDSVRAIATKHNLPWSAFSFDDGAAAQAALQNKRLLLSVTDPPSIAAKMIDACLASGTHYLDTSGKIPIFEHAAKQDSAAKQIGICLLPGVGFDIAPSDCLAAHTAAHSKNPASLNIAIQDLGPLARDTIETMLEDQCNGTAVRRNGKVRYTRTRLHLRQFDFGHGAREFLRLSRGDIAAAYYSTGIGDIEVFMPNEGLIKSFVKARRYLGFLVQTAPLQALWKNQIEKAPTEEDIEDHGKASALFRAEVTDESGSVFISQLVTPNRHAVTAEASILAVMKVLEGEVERGFKTPSMAFGSRFIDELTDCKQEDH